ncbi:MAG TPA: hypothetical protein V6C82_01985 [Chroococcales cyanobacterium]|jgi:tetratricopeptide (TPR) repeat protein
MKKVKNEIAVLLFLLLLFPAAASGEQGKEEKSDGPKLQLFLNLPAKAKKEESTLSEAWNFYLDDAFLLCASRLDGFLLFSRRHSLDLGKLEAFIAILYEQCAVGIDESGANEAARETIEKAIALAPRSYSIRYHQGLILKNGSRTKEAIEALEAAIALCKPENRLSSPPLIQRPPREISEEAKSELKSLE